jgi:hypothetical protein
MNRLDHIQKAQAALSQVIAHLQAAEHYHADIETRLLYVESEMLTCEEACAVRDPDPYLTALEAE